MPRLLPADAPPPSAASSIRIDRSEARPPRTRATWVPYPHPAGDEKALQKEVDTGKSKTVTLREPAPVLVMTSSVVVSGDGRVDFLADLYGQDDSLLASLDGTPVPPEKRETKSVAEPWAMPFAPRSGMAISGDAPSTGAAALR